MEIFARLRNFRRNFSLDLKASEKSEGTFSVELDREEAIPLDAATSKGPQDRLFAIFEIYLANN